MMITQALELADSEHVVHFLLTAYIETLYYYDSTRTVFPAQLRQLPLEGKSDLDGRLRVLRVLRDEQRRDDRRRIIEEAVEVFTAASRNLNAFAALRLRSELRERTTVRLQSRPLRVTAVPAPPGV